MIYYLILLIDDLVHDYFYTFRYCWTITLISLTDMINNYINFLDSLSTNMLAYPNPIILGCILIICLYIIKEMINNLLSFS